MKIKSLILPMAVMVVIAVMVMGCNPAKKWEKEEKQLIQDYVNSLGDTTYTLTSSGLYFIQILEGGGIQPTDNDSVSIKYKGKFMSGRVFDSNMGSTSTFKFVVGSGYVIPGLDEGVKLMKNGGKAKMLTPSSLAYGAAGMYPLIPGYAPLLWDIELVSVKPRPGK